MMANDIINSIKYKQTYMILAMRRTGHHGVSNWLCRQTEMDSLYWDQCQARRTEKFLSPIGAAIYYDEKNNKEQKPYRLEEFDKIKYKSVNNCFISIETFAYLQDDRIGKFEDVIGLKNIKPTHFILVNRDFFNWMGSCMTLARAGKGGGLFRQRYVMANMWKEFIRESMKPSIFKGHNIVDINYNKWFTSKEYREEVCSRLGLDFTDNGLNYMLRGSTFNKLKYQDKAQKMNVMNRYKNCLKDKEYWKLIDDEIIELSKQYFGFIPKEISGKWKKAKG